MTAALRSIPETDLFYTRAKIKALPVTPVAVKGIIS